MPQRPSEGDFLYNFIYKKIVLYKKQIPAIEDGKKT